MKALYTSTLKYFRLAIAEFLPLLKELNHKGSNQESKEKLENMIEAYEDIACKIDEYNLNLEDPNKYFDGEPHEIELNLSDPMIEELVRLTVRLLDSYKNQLSVLERKSYLTEDNEKNIYRLKNLVWPLEAFTKEESYVLGKYSKAGPLEFPGERNKVIEKYKIETTNIMPTAVFSETLIEKTPKDVGTMCREFNFNFEHYKPHSCMLILRRILPLSIVKKFQEMNKEVELKKSDGEFYNTETLLGKVETVLKDKRIYKEIKIYKGLLDGSQHSFSLNLDITDTQGAGIVIRRLLDDIF